MSRTALYRHFDQLGRLLYVGISLDAVRRLGQHKQHAAWYSRITTICVEWYPTRAAAEAAEREGIRRERPKHNVAHVSQQAREYCAWGIFHPKSGRFDCWYFDESMAAGVLDFWREVCQGEAFMLVKRSADQPAAVGREPIRSLMLDLSEAA